VVGFFARFQETFFLRTAADMTPATSRHHQEVWGSTPRRRPKASESSAVSREAMSSHSFSRRGCRHAGQNARVQCLPPCSPFALLSSKRGRPPPARSEAGRDIDRCHIRPAARRTVPYPPTTMPSHRRHRRVTTGRCHVHADRAFFAPFHRQLIPTARWRRCCSLSPHA
jgi:hypothetical protein